MNLKVQFPPQRHREKTEKDFAFLCVSVPLW